MFSGGLGHGQVEPGRRLGKSHLWAERPSLGLSAETGTAQGQSDLHRQWGWGVEVSTGISDLSERRSRLMLLPVKMTELISNPLTVSLCKNHSDIYHSFSTLSSGVRKISSAAVHIRGGGYKSVQPVWKANWPHMSKLQMLCISWDTAISLLGIYLQMHSLTHEITYAQVCIASL